ncbi:MAG: glycoside hydrolase family 32 protein [Anaerolineae bacterium]
MPASIQDFAEQRRALAHDAHRPSYHFVAPAHWMNDPNGVIQWGGRFHLFYQHNPLSAEFGLMHWGHAISQDLIHWSDLPTALTPTPDSPDERGCWSGCSVDNGGVPTLVYTGVRGARYEVQTQCLATSSDDLITWEKYTGNPVLSEIPAESKQNYDFRDPYVWREGESWYLVLASRIVGVGGAAFLYRSPDLIHWEYLHPLLVGSIEKTGSVWECPSFFPLGDKWVLVVAGKGAGIPVTVFYFVGEYVNQRFTPESEGVLDHGYFYAPYTMRDDQSRRLLWGWLREGRSEAAHSAAGWAGAHAIPRVLSLRDDHLHMEPVPELIGLRGTQADFADIRLEGEDVALDVEGLALDITAEFEPAGTVGIALACAPDGSEQTRITYDPAAQRLTVNRERSSLGSGNETFPTEASHALPGEPLRLRILLDGSLLEVIADGRTSLCSRIYPSAPTAGGYGCSGRGRSGR